MNDLALPAPATADRVWPAMKVAWVAALAILLYANVTRQLPAGVTAGVALQGVITGSLTGLTAIGLVVVYRANRIINFAQSELGVVASVLAYNLMVAAHLPWIVAVVIALLAATALSAAMEFAVIRRLGRAPRLIATVATIGLTQVLAFIAITVAGTFDRYNYERIQSAGLRFITPLSRHAFRMSGISFSYDELLVLIVVPVVLVALGWFFGRSLLGVAVRAAAQNGERAGLLGIRVPRLSTIAWLLAGALSAIAALLQAPVLGFNSFGAAAVGASLGVFVRALAAAVIARMESIPVAFGAAIALGITERVVFYNYAQSAALEVALLALVLASLLLQRRRLSRASWVEASTWQAARAARAPSAALLAQPRVRLAKRVAFAVLVGVPLLLPTVVGIETVRLLSVVCVYAIVGLSLVLLSGWAGQVSLGQWAIAGVGAFAGGRLAVAYGLDLVVAVALAGFAGACVALLVGLPALRIRGLFLGATTVILATACERWLFTLPAVRPDSRLERPTMFGVFHPQSEKAYFYVAFAALALTTIALSNVRRSAIGRALLAVRDNEPAGQAYAIDPSIVKLGAFAVSGFIAASAGCLYAYLQQSVDVSQFSAFTSLFLFSMVVIGGIGSIPGAIIGAVYVSTAQYFLPEAGRYLATGLGLLVLLLLLPGGLSQLAYAARDRAIAWLTTKPAS